MLPIGAQVPEKAEPCSVHVVLVHFTSFHRSQAGTNKDDVFASTDAESSTAEHLYSPAAFDGEG